RHRHRHFERFLEIGATGGGAGLHPRPVLRHADDHRRLLCRDGEIMPTAVSLTEKLSSFSDHWSPKIISRFNGHDVMVVKVKGEFVWHSHPETDDFFLVLNGNLTIQLRDGEVRLGP